MNSKDTMIEKGCCDTKRRGLALYFSLLSVQTVGAVILLSNLIPLYRLITHDFANYRPDARSGWAFAGMLLIQVAYWLRVRLGPSLPRTGNIVLGHIIFFFSRMSFVVATAGFTQMFLNHFEDLKTMNYPPLRALVVLMMFFSLFCWTLELERLAKALQGSKDETCETHRD